MLSQFEVSHCAYSRHCFFFFTSYFVCTSLYVVLPRGELKRIEVEIPPSSKDFDNNEVSRRRTDHLQTEHEEIDSLSGAYLEMPHLRLERRTSRTRQKTGRMKWNRARGVVDKFSKCEDASRTSESQARACRGRNFWKCD
jgi:hypothetical protein